jgi:hypothetical protein
MSLSFVSSAILTSTDGVSHNEETEVSNKDKSGAVGLCQKSLFEQLRSNQDEEDAKRMESELSRIRGTLALNEDDVAHLNALHQTKLTVEQQRRVELEYETAQFRAHQMLRRSEQTEDFLPESLFDANQMNNNQDLMKSKILPNIDNQQNGGISSHVTDNQKSSTSLRIIMPKIVVKHKIEKKRKFCESDLQHDIEQQSSNKSSNPLKEEEDKVDHSCNQNHGLETLLDVYGSSSDEEEE